MVNINNVLNCKELFPKLLWDILFPRYVKDYGKENEEEIVERIENTTFVFEGNPVVTKDFINGHLDEIKDEELITRTNTEYDDFVSKKESIQELLLKELERILDSIIDNNDLSEGFKEFIRTFRSKIIESFNSGVIYKSKFINSSDVPLYVSEIVKPLEKLLLRKNTMIIEKTIWGRRILKETNCLFSAEDLGKALLNNETTGSVSSIKTSTGYHTLCHMPLMLNTEDSLDRLLLHQLRCVVETKNKKMGIVNIDSPAYERINTARTRWNAILDEQAVRQNYICLFGNGNLSDDSAFYFSSDSGGFIIDNKALLNKIAFNEALSATTYFPDDQLLDIEMNGFHNR